jgi:hypothetical protein
MIKFSEFIAEGNKMRTNAGFEFAISKVEKVQKFADKIDMSDSRVVAGIILDWCKLNKVKFEVLAKKVEDGEIDKKLAKRVFQMKNIRSKTKGSEELLGLLKGV